MIDPAYAKAVCVGAQCNPFSCLWLSRLTGPSRPLGEMAGRVAKEAKTPIFIVVYGTRPSPPTPRFWWRGGGQGANSIWRQSDCAWRTAGAGRLRRLLGFVDPSARHCYSEIDEERCPRISRSGSRSRLL